MTNDSSAIAPASEEAIERFCDACWLEDGLAKNSLSAYRRDLLLLAQWLFKQSGIDLYAVKEKDLTAYIAHRRTDKATTANRRLTVFKRFYRHALRMNLVKSDPCIGLRAAKQALRFPKTLTEDQVTALLNTPDIDTPLGLRDRTMLELMYASGLRVSELVLLKSIEVGMNEGVLRVTGKGSKNLKPHHVKLWTTQNQFTYQLVKLVIKPTAAIRSGFMAIANAISGMNKK